MIKNEDVTKKKKHSLSYILYHSAHFKEKRYAIVALVNWLQQKYNTPMFNTWLHLLDSVNQQYSCLACSSLTF